MLSVPASLKSSLWSGRSFFVGVVVSLLLGSAILMTRSNPFDMTTLSKLVSEKAAPQAEITQPSLPCSGKIGLVVRTFGADSHVFASLVPQLKAFVNSEDFEVHFVLDEEGENDHVMGAALEELGYIVHYEARPPESVLEPRPFAMLGGKYAGQGYMRGQYAIYFLDRWLDCEIVGVIDSDAHFSSFLTREVAVRNDQVVIQGHENSYAGDLRAVGSTKTFSLMHRNYFPQFLYRDAWQVARTQLMRIWGGHSFDEAYLKWTGPDPTIPINHVAHMALFNDSSNRYRIVMSENPLEFAVPAVAWNFDANYKHHACCRVYGVGCADGMLTDTNHLFNPRVSIFPKAVDWHHLEDAARIHYEHVHARLAALDPDEVAVMRSYCETMTPAGWVPVTPKVDRPDPTDDPLLPSTVPGL